ncbi:MAG: NUDIX hydrolase [Ruminococcaceae bacterium]|nr:NUDIX hydrolase [Oscillospiraceae bacterium]
MKMRDAKGMTEEEFLESYKQKNYPKPSLTADVVIFTEKEGELAVLLIKRGGHPYIGKWALPGGFANANECIEQTAERELFEETGIEGMPLTEIGLFTRPGRDPRGWVVSQVYASSAVYGCCRPVAGDDAKETAWFSVRADEDTVELRCGDTDIRYSYRSEGSRIGVEYLTDETLAFDHGEILIKALEKMGYK